MITRKCNSVLSWVINAAFITLIGYFVSLALDTSWGELVTEFFMNVQKNIADRFSNYFLSPVYELILGITLGVDYLELIPRFNDVAISLGIIHILVVSGYNINLIISLVYNFFPQKYKFSAVFTAGIVAIIYALIVGLTAPVIRAVVMCLMFVVYAFTGRSRNALNVLMLSLCFFVGYDIEMLTSLSLQLSFLASLGLILLYDIVYRYLSNNFTLIPELFKIDLSATISAQLFTAPLIYLSFGRFSLISLIVNMLLLCFIPFLTILGLIFIPFMYLSDHISKVLSHVITDISLIFFFCCDILYSFA